MIKPKTNVDKLRDIYAQLYMSKFEKTKTSLSCNKLRKISNTMPFICYNSLLVSINIRICMQNNSKTQEHTRKRK